MLLWQVDTKVAVDPVELNNPQRLGTLEVSKRRSVVCLEGTAGSNMNVKGTIEWGDQTSVRGMIEKTCIALVKGTRHHKQNSLRLLLMSSQEEMSNAVLKTVNKMISSYIVAEPGWIGFYTFVYSRTCKHWIYPFSWEKFQVEYWSCSLIYHFYGKMWEKRTKLWKELLSTKKAVLDDLGECWPIQMQRMPN